MLNFLFFGWMLMIMILLRYVFRSWFLGGGILIFLLIMWDIWYCLCYWVKGIGMIGGWCGRLMCVVFIGLFVCFYFLFWRVRIRWLLILFWLEFWCWFLVWVFISCLSWWCCVCLSIWWWIMSLGVCWCILFIWC